MLEVISRKKAIERGFLRYFTGIPCKNGHISERSCSNRNCLDCAAKRQRIWVSSNPDKSRKSSLMWKLNNPDRVVEYSRKWGSENAEKKRQSVRAWMRKHPDKVRARNATRRAARKRAQPSWLTEGDLKEILSMYEMAFRLERETGIKHHVDHIVPLRGKYVSGLHVPWNLRVVTASDNLRKSNKLYD